LLAIIVTRLPLNIWISPVIPGTEPNAFCDTAALVPGVRACGLEIVAKTAADGFELFEPGVTLPVTLLRRSLVFELKPVVPVVFEFDPVFELVSIMLETEFPDPASEDNRSLAALEPLPVVPVAPRSCDVPLVL
jgi:hypothetical protein